LLVPATTSKGEAPKVKTLAVKPANVVACCKALALPSPSTGTKKDQQVANEAALRKVALKGDNNEIIRLSLLGTDVDAVDEHGESALHVAAAHGRSETVALLVSKLGADANRQAKAGETPLHLSATGGHGATLRLLARSFGGDPCCQDRDGLTPAHNAALGGHDSTLRLLADEFGADLSAMDKDGLTPLHAAALKGNESTVRMLVEEFGADPSAADVDGETPLHVAVSTHTHRLNPCDLSEMFIAEIGFFCPVLLPWLVALTFALF